ncbi:hypothetical protein FHS01_001673 [Longimicrobium terrae]|uniref:Uncharacterized protein n=1 Tax=Longimicrobium terrae TaxID=1639882 RepID=A0A841GX11_9BACT|nr:hypothetical protein [Longimicrobium terrae]MBB6070055.1 hypothetical protein [Longimicrobium terrae]
MAVRVPGEAGRDREVVSEVESSGRNAEAVPPGVWLRDEFTPDPEIAQRSSHSRGRVSVRDGGFRGAVRASRGVSRCITSGYGGAGNGSRQDSGIPSPGSSRGIGGLDRSPSDISGHKWDVRASSPPHPCPPRDVLETFRPPPGLDRPRPSSRHPPFEAVRTPWRTRAPLFCGSIAVHHRRGRSRDHRGVRLPLEEPTTSRDVRPGAHDRRSTMMSGRWQTRCA